MNYKYNILPIYSLLTYSLLKCVSGEKTIIMKTNKQKEHKQSKKQKTKTN